MDNKDLRIPLKMASFSGRLSAIYSKHPDKVGNMKLSFTISLTPSGKKGKQSYANITCYDLDIERFEWFKVGTYVYTQCSIIKDGFYILDYISDNSYDCYQKFIEQVYSESNIKEEGLIR